MFVMYLFYINYSMYVCETGVRVSQFREECLTQVTARVTRVMAVFITEQKLSFECSRHNPDASEQAGRYRPHTVYKLYSFFQFSPSPRLYTISLLSMYHGLINYTVYVETKAKCRPPNKI